jgi:AcrR family transcriptional regulator/DNA-binding MarR family transcriptional regulator
MRSAAGLPREHVSEVQRMRILGAMAEVAGERGIESATIARVVKRAGVSRRTFYDLFEDRGACFNAVFDETVALAEGQISAAWQTQGDWIDRVRAALIALLTFLDEQPELARSCVVQALAGGPALLARRADLLKVFAEAIDQGRVEVRGEQPPALTAEGVVGAVFSIVHARLLDGEQAPLVGLSGSLMGLIVLSYRGPAAARRELARPLAPVGETWQPAAKSFMLGDPLDGLGMRVTYRTLRVLALIAERPGVSNREVGEGAGIVDQGQMSRLLTRLESLGLVDNTGAGHLKGATNAWRLTPKGTEVQRAVNIETKQPRARVARR